MVTAHTSQMGIITANIFITFPKASMSVMHVTMKCGNRKFRQSFDFIFGVACMCLQLSGINSVTLFAVHLISPKHFGLNYTTKRIGIIFFLEQIEFMMQIITKQKANLVLEHSFYLLSK